MLQSSTLHKRLSCSVLFFIRLELYLTHTRTQPQTSTMSLPGHVSCTAASCVSWHVPWDASSSHSLPHFFLEVLLLGLTCHFRTNTIRRFAFIISHGCLTLLILVLVLKPYVWNEMCCFVRLPPGLWPDVPLKYVFSTEWMLKRISLWPYRTTYQ